MIFLDLPYSRTSMSGSWTFTSPHLDVLFRRAAHKTVNYISEVAGIPHAMRPHLKRIDI